MARKAYRKVIMSDVEASGVGSPAGPIDGFRHHVIQLVLESSPDGTLTFPGSSSGSVPNFAIAASEANRYAGKRVDGQDGSGNIGGAGQDLSLLSDGVYEFKVNTDSLRWLSAKWASRTQGKISISLVSTNDTLAAQPA